MKKYNAARYQRVKEHHNAVCRAWEKRNPEKLREMWKRSHEKHREKRNKATREWWKNNPERGRELKRKHAANSVARRRARIMGAPALEAVNRQYIFERDGGKCHLCLYPVDPGNFHLDHLVPLSKGGEHTNRNLRVAHPGCNSRRGDGRIPAQLLLFG